MNQFFRWFQYLCLNLHVFVQFFWFKEIVIILFSKMGLMNNSKKEV
jgi:hypothetical protein